MVLVYIEILYVGFLCMLGDLVSNLNIDMQIFVVSLILVIYSDGIQICEILIYCVNYKKIVVVIVYVVCDVFKVIMFLCMYFLINSFLSF